MLSSLVFWEPQTQRKYPSSHTLESLRGSHTGVYPGIMTADYNDTLTLDHNTMSNYFATGTN